MMLKKRKKDGQVSMCEKLERKKDGQVSMGKYALGENELCF